jgi:2-(1,2-epoxy-1,2-dihydrophenyl)acetyl-CoA isomerase
MSMQTDSLIVQEHVGDVAILTMSDPATLNAASFPMVSEFIDALDQASGSARALVITGSGRGFCSGAKLSSDLHIDAPEYDAGAALDTHYNPLMLALRDYPLPIITAVNGAAAGIGCTIALAGDIVIAAQDAYFLQAFRRIGLVPDGGSAYLLAHAIGRARAMEMMLLGEKLPADRALAWGLINRVVPAGNLRAEALTLAQDLASGPTKALREIRRQCWEATESSFTATLARERAQQRDIGRTADHREGVAAFLAKRPAKFTGQ